jgi:AcrR family transcriptional regulator
MVSGPTFHAWLELAVASRTDPELRRAIQGLTGKLRDLIADTFRELFGHAHAEHPFFVVAPHFAFALLDGLALERIAGGDDAEAMQVIDALKALARLTMPPADTDTPS